MEPASSRVGGAVGPGWPSTVDGDGQRANTLGRGDSDGGPVPHSLVRVSCCVFNVSRRPQTSRGCPVVSQIGSPSERGWNLFVPAAGPLGSDRKAVFNHPGGT